MERQAQRRPSRDTDVTCVRHGSPAQRRRQGGSVGMGAGHWLSTTTEQNVLKQ